MKVPFPVAARRERATRWRSADLRGYPALSLDDRPDSRNGYRGLKFAK